MLPAPFLPTPSEGRRERWLLTAPRPAGLLLPGWLITLLSIEGRQRRGESMDRETCKKGALQICAAEGNNQRVPRPRF